MSDNQDFFNSSNSVVTMTLQLVDDSTGKIIMTQISALKDQAIKPLVDPIINSYVQKGFLVDRGNLPEKAQDGMFKVILKHNVTIKPTDVALTRKIVMSFASGAKEDVVKTQAQTIKCVLHTDKVTGQTTLKDVMAHFDEFKLPEFAGYMTTDTAPSIDVDITLEDVKKGEKTILETVNYLPQTQVMSVFFDDTVTGKTNAKQYQGLTDMPIPTSYIDFAKSLESSGYTVIDLPKGAVFGSGDLHVKLGHQFESLQDSPDLHLTKTRTVNYIKGVTVADSIAQTVTLSRTGTRDKVTGDIHYSAYNTDAFTKLPPKEYPGYAPSEEASEMIVTDKTPESSTLAIHLTPLENHIRFVFYDKTAQIRQSDYDLTAYTDEALDLTRFDQKVEDLRSENYDVQIPQIPSVMPAGGDTITVPLTHIFEDLPEDDPSLKTTVTRQIIFKGGHNNLPDPITQTADFTRTGQLDVTTNQKIYGDWSSPVVLPEIEVPKVLGYSTVVNVVSSKTVSAEDQDSSQDLIYIPDNRHIKIELVDDVSGNVLTSAEKSGTVDSPIPINVEGMRNSAIKTGYKIVRDETEELPNDDVEANGIDQNALVFPAKQEKSTYVIHLDHVKTPVVKSNPINPVTGRDVSSYLTSFKEYDISYETYQGKVLGHQIAKRLYDRMGYCDMVTGQIEYQDWETTYEDPLSAPNDPDYMPEDLSYPEEDGKVVIRMIPKVQTIDVKFYSFDDRKVIQKESISLNPEGSLNLDEHLKSFLDKGYAVNKTDLPEDPKYDKHLGLTRELTIRLHEIYDSKLESKIINRKITTMIENDPKTAIVHSDAARLIRKVEKSRVNPDHVKLGPWSTSAFGEYRLPALPDYHIEQAVIPAAKVTIESSFKPLVLNYTKELPAPKTHEVPKLSKPKIVTRKPTVATTDVENKQIKHETKEKRDGQLKMPKESHPHEDPKQTKAVVKVSVSDVNKTEKEEKAGHKAKPSFFERLKHFWD